MSQYAIVTDLNRCVGCMACMVACKAVNNVQIGNFWNKVLRVGPTKKADYVHTNDVEGASLARGPDGLRGRPPQAHLHTG